MMTGIIYSLVIKFKDYARAEQMLKMITPDRRKALSEYYQGLLEESEKLIAANASIGSAETPDNQNAQS